MTRTFLIAVLGFAFGGSVLAQDATEITLFPDTEYVSGRAGLTDKTKGILSIEPSEVRLTKDGKVAISIPMNTVAAVSFNTETDPGSFGRKMAFGVFASRREEYLTIKTETSAVAEAIVFKCKKKTSEGMAAKIEFFRKKLAPSPAPPSPQPQ
jgi:hypothetical protein